MLAKEIRIVFMGTPEFAVESLKILVENGYNVVGVVTIPDKPSGRGQKVAQSAVKEYAMDRNIPLLQPEKLKNPEFIEGLKAWKADLQVVVAFRMLPEIIWQMPPMGTINLHGSLLPQYRGAAPINWAVINGESETGATTFMLQHEIDTGNLIYQERFPILESDNVGTVHDRMMVMGSHLIMKTVNAIAEGNYPQINQLELLKPGMEVRHAPKIYKEDCKINWHQTGRQIFNFIRGLSPYPSAFTVIKNESKSFLLKIFDSRFIEEVHTLEIGEILSDNKSYLKVAVKEGFIEVLNLQLEGKKRLPINDLLNGFNPTGFRMES